MIALFRVSNSATRHITSSLYRCSFHRRSIHNDHRQRLRKIWIPTRGIAPTKSETESSSLPLMVRAGFVRQAYAGVFHLLPLGLRVQEKLENLVDKHMKRLGASKLALSAISSRGIWHKSGRFMDSKDDLFHLRDRNKSGYILSPTHEEEITALVSGSISSYKDLPLRLYQINRKYRNELRPRNGLLRTREFVMKDLYTFDESPQLAMYTYESVRESYANIFRELGLPYMVAAADSGNIGGSLSHEYHLLSDGGEDRLVSCQSCGFVANEEVVAMEPPDRERAAPLADDANQLAQGHGQEASEDAPKFTDGDPCPKCRGGKVAVRKAVELAHTFLLGTRYSHAFHAKIDGRPVSLNNRPPSVGGDKNGAQAPTSPAESPLAESTASKSAPAKIPVQMGCYGIGISRILGAAAGSLMDKTGLNWPRAMAPYEVVVIPGPGNELDAETVYDTLVSAQPASAAAEQQASYPRHGAASTVPVDVVLDDRLHHTSWKLRDADLIGFPVIVVLGRAWREKHVCEVQCRRLSHLREEAAVQDLPNFVASLLEKL